MVQNKSKAGRPIEFTEEKVLTDAMNLFWERGYSSVGISDLEKHTHLNRSSLYNVFGSKEKIFTQALTFYTNNVAPAMMLELKTAKDGLSDLRHFTEKLVSYLCANTGRGCFMVNTMAATDSSQPDTSVLAENYIRNFLDVVSTTLRRAAEKDEIKIKYVNSFSELYLGAVLSANLLSRSNQQSELISGLLYSALSAIEANKQ